MGRHNTFNPRRWATAGPIIVALALTACGGNDDDDAGEAETDLAATITAGAPTAGGDMIATEETAPADQAAGGSQTGIDFGQVGRDVVVEMHVVMSSDDIARSVSAITSDAAALGGGVASSAVDYGVVDGRSTTPTGHAVLVVRVPPDRVDRLLEGL
ncbi:MAG TPA: hypothetical protein VF065_01745, partial [Ilumatobacter sp.]